MIGGLALELWEWGCRVLVKRLLDAKKEFVDSVRMFVEHALNLTTPLIMYKWHPHRGLISPSRDTVSVFRLDNKSQRCCLIGSFEVVTLMRSLWTRSILFVPMFIQWQTKNPRPCVMPLFGRQRFPEFFCFQSRLRECRRAAQKIFAVKTGSCFCYEGNFHPWTFG